MQLLGHGIGSRGDLPLPVGALLAGAIAAIVISFIVLSRAWKSSRFGALAAGRTMGSTSHPLGRVFTGVGRVLGAVIVFTAIYSALFVTNNTVENISPRLVYVFFWVVVPLASFVVGDVWRWLSPFEALARFGDRRTAHRDGLGPEALSLYVPAAGLLLFHWVELAYHEPAATPVLALLLGAWILASGVGAVLWGSTWLRSRDPLAVWCRLIAAGSPVFVRDGKWGLRLPFVGLADAPIQRGISAIVMVVLGGTTFDGVTRTDFWGDIVGTNVGWSATMINTLGLVLTMSVLLALYLGAIRLMQRIAGTDDERFDDVFALTLLPVAVGYSIAHYFSLAVFEGQFLLIQASDPFGQRWNLFGTRLDYVNYTLIGTTAVAWVQALGIIVGHLAGVVVGHDRAVAELPEREFERSQLPLVGLMVTLTCFGLLLLVEA
jgi:hypothetical protein